MVLGDVKLGNYARAGLNDLYDTLLIFAFPDSAKVDCQMTVR
jgi:hypothetical protein